MSFTVSLAPFKLLIYVFPTVLFFIGFTSRLIITFVRKGNTMQEIFGYIQSILDKTLKDFADKSNINISELLRQAFINAGSDKQIEGGADLFQNNLLIEEEKNKRNSHFLYSLFIDSLALSMANGVIIMFDAQNLFYGFVLLFIGVVLCSFGFAALYVDRQHLTVLLVSIILTVFIMEAVYLVTLNSAWFYIIPTSYVVLLMIVVIIALTANHIKKKKQQ